MTHYTSLISPPTKTLFEVTPLPTHPEVNPNVAFNWWGPVPSIQRSWTTSLRVDQRFSDNDQFYARYTQGNFSSLGIISGAGVPALDWARVPGNTQSNFAPNKNLAAS